MCFGFVYVAGSVFNCNNQTIRRRPNGRDCSADEDRKSVKPLSRYNYLMWGQMTSQVDCTYWSSIEKRKAIGILSRQTVSIFTVNLSLYMFHILLIYTSLSLKNAFKYFFNFSLIRFMNQHWLSLPLE